MVLAGNIRVQSYAAPALAMSLLFGIAMAEPAAGCGAGDACAADAIDAFFLPLITHSLAETLQHVTPPPTLPPTPSASITVITAPPYKAPPPPPPEPVPMQQLVVGQTLFAGKLDYGGEADLYFEILPDTEGVPDAPANGSVLESLALVIDSSDPEMLTMERLVLLPVAAAWPLQSISQPVVMTATCGACGPDGDILHFDGTGTFEVQLEPWGYGKISDIDLRGSDDRTMQGEMRFSLRVTNGNVLYDADSTLWLVIGQDDIDLVSTLLAWRGIKGAVSGIFIAVPQIDSADPGAIAGQFSGADCVPVCGVEN